LGYADWINALGYDRVIPAFPGSGGKIENGVVCYEIVSRIVQPTTIGECLEKPLHMSGVKKNSIQAGFPVSISRNMDACKKHI
jgi:2-dehydropantoate 2-reductase